MKVKWLVRIRLYVWPQVDDWLFFMHCDIDVECGVWSNFSS
jgi:hypothetical protein